MSNSFLSQLGRQPTDGSYTVTVTNGVPTYTQLIQSSGTHAEHRLRFEGVVDISRHSERLVFGGGPTSGTTADQLRVELRDNRNVIVETRNFPFRLGATVNSTLIDNLIADTMSNVAPVAEAELRTTTGIYRGDNIAILPASGSASFGSTDGRAFTSATVDTNARSGEDWNTIVRLNADLFTGSSTPVPEAGQTIGHYLILYPAAIAGGTPFGGGTAPGDFGIYRITSQVFDRTINIFGSGVTTYYNFGLEFVASAGTITSTPSGNNRHIMGASFSSNPNVLFTRTGSNLPNNFTLQRDNNDLLIAVSNPGIASFTSSIVAGTPNDTPITVSSNVIQRGAAMGETAGTLMLGNEPLRITVGQRDDEIALRAAYQHSFDRFIGTVRDVHETADDATTVYTAVNPGSIPSGMRPLIADADGNALADGVANTTAIPGITITSTYTDGS